MLVERTQILTARRLTTLIALIAAGLAAACHRTSPGGDADARPTRAASTSETGSARDDGSGYLTDDVKSPSGVYARLFRDVYGREPSLSETESLAVGFTESARDEARRRTILASILSTEPEPLSVLVAQWVKALWLRTESLDDLKNDGAVSEYVDLILTGQTGARTVFEMIAADQRTIDAAGRDAAMYERTLYQEIYGRVRRPQEPTLKMKGLPEERLAVIHQLLNHEEALRFELAKAWSRYTKPRDAKRDGETEKALLDLAMSDELKALVDACGDARRDPTVIAAVLATPAYFAGE